MTAPNSDHPPPTEPETTRVDQPPSARERPLRDDRALSNPDPRDGAPLGQHRAIEELAVEVIESDEQLEVEVVLECSPVAYPRYGYLAQGQLGAAGAAVVSRAPLRVIHVGPCLTRGGAEQWLVDLVRFLDPARVQIARTIVTMPEHVDPDFTAELPIPFEIGQAEAVRRAARECDAMLCWGLPLDDWLLDCRPKLCVCVAHGEGFWTQHTLERSARVVDHVVAVSQRVRDRACAGLGLPTTVIPNGVDTARLARTRSRDEVRQALGFGPDDFILGFVGRFSGEKRPDAILDAVAQLPPRFKALLVGRGPMRHELLEQANQHIPGRYAFVTANRYLGDDYHAMDAFCLIGTEEGCSLALLEAMHCERPVIVTPVGSVPEIILDRINGLIVSGAPETLRLAVERLDRHPSWAHGLAAEGRAFAERHGHAARMSRDYEDLLTFIWSEKHGDLVL
jgi:glycosyltransferase involved in cell wall biosynthesis